MSQIDYNKIFNEEFLKTVEIPLDAPKWNIRLIIEKEDHKIINNIFNKKTYNNLNEKEIDILKKFIESIDLHELNSKNNINDKSDNTIKEIINDILHLSIDKLLVLLNEIQINGFFNISTGFFNDEIYLGLGQSKNNISNNKCYSSEKFMNIYKNTIKKCFELYFSNEISEKLIDKILKYEMEIITNKLSSVKRREVNETINIYDIDEIKFKNFDLKNIVNLILNKANVKYPKNKIIIDVKAPFTFYNILDNFLIEPEFRYYLVWCFLYQIASYTSNKLNNYKFEIIKIIKGIVKQTDFRKKKVQICNELIGHLVSKEYLSLVDPKIKTNIEILIEYIKKSFRNRLLNNTWMDSETKKKAIEKLDNMKFIIGTGILIDYSKIQVLVEDNYILNVKTLINYIYYYRIKLIEKYEKLFYGNVYDVNAYYDPTLNLMIFPYGILRPPYFYSVDMKNLKNIENIAYNFGAIGSVIGHEMIHGFDDQGRKFDKNGILNKNSSWWNKESEDKYKILSEKIIEKYKKYNINGNLTLGENIADIGGLHITYNALINLIREGKNNNVDKLIETANYNFIKAWTMIWRSKIKPQEYENQLLNDVHSPAHVRVNIPLNNIFEKVNDKIFIEKKNKEEQIW
jgi:predicted metalloendopeptidase